MLIYWLLLAFPALMAVSYPSGPYVRTGAGRAVALTAFLIAYTLLSWLRFEVGGDWGSYLDMLGGVRGVGLGEALTKGDPLFSLLLWTSNVLGWGIYPVNGICSLLLGYGVIRVARTLRDPWLAIVVAVPYLLIVVGMGYVRQGAAIGLMLMAVASLAAGRQRWMIFQLFLALLFHSTSIVVWPLFALAAAARNKLRIVGLTVIAVAAYFGFVASRISQFETGYIDSTYDSSGALPRILLTAVFSVPVLLRWRSFEAPPLTRPIWLGFAVLNLACLLALGFLPSTAVDRLALYLSPLQIFVAGSSAALIFGGRQSNLLVRLLMIGAACVVQLVWLVFATHATYWVPYRSLLGLY